MMTLWLKDVLPDFLNDVDVDYRILSFEPMYANEIQATLRDAERNRE